MKPTTTLLTLAIITLATACGSSDPGSDDNGGDQNPQPNNTQTDPNKNKKPNTTTPPDNNKNNKQTNPGPKTPPFVPKATSVVTCAASSLPKPPTGSCSVTPGTTEKGVVLIGKALLGADATVYENGRIVIDAGIEGGAPTDSSGKITCVGCNCEAPGAAVIYCPEDVISPGMLNAHDHITYNHNAPVPHGNERYDHRHDWRKGLNGHSQINYLPGLRTKAVVTYSELRHLIAGTTSIAGSGGSEGLVRNLDVKNLAEGLLDARVKSETFPLGDADGRLSKTACSVYQPYSKTERKKYETFLPHVAEGVNAEARNEYVCLAGTDGGSADLIDHHTSIIHGIGLTSEDVDDFAKRGGKLVWSPRSNIDLYGFTADVLSFRRRHIPIALGTDWIPSGSMNLFRELACAANFNEDYLNKQLTNRELWSMVTEDAAKALGVADEVGTLKVGMVADIIVMKPGEWSGDAKDAHTAIVKGHEKNVRLVLRGGLPLYGEASIVEPLLPNRVADACETISVCGVDRTLCLKHDTSLSYENDLKMHSSNQNYPLFFCDTTPDSEPSCIPYRANEFTGDILTDDNDGDGIKSDQDLCADIFSAPRPLDGATQRDSDGDGVGDSCDVCPLDKNDQCDNSPIIIQDDPSAELTPPSGCSLLISELLEGKGYNKAVEIFNCSGADLDTTHFGLCVVNGDDPCGKDMPIKPVTLAPNGVHTICNGRNNNDPELLNKCNETSSNIAFNGDDPVFIYFDKNKSGSYDPTDVIIDAFGDPANKPSDKNTWKDKKYDRCNGAPYTGSAPFSAATYYTEIEVNDGDPTIYDTLGVAPNLSGCP